MGLFKPISKWLQKKGSTGSIARWVIKYYNQIKASNPDMGDDNVIQMLFDTRYSSVPPKEGERKRFEKVKRYGEETGYYIPSLNIDVLSMTMSIPEPFTSLHALCMGIIFIEMDVSQNDTLIYEQCSEVISEILSNHGITKKVG